MNFQKEASWVKQRVVKAANGLGDRWQQGGMAQPHQNGGTTRLLPRTPSPPATPPSDLQQPIAADKLLRRSSSISKDDFARSSRRNSSRDLTRQNLSAAAAAAGKLVADDKPAGPAEPHPAAGLEPLTFVQVQLLGFILVFAVSGLVPVDDLNFVLFACVYALALNWLAFPPLSEPPERPPFSRRRWFKAYMLTAAVLGLFLPLAYVLGGFARGDQGAVQRATPHLFLLSCQVLSESLMANRRWVSLPTRAAVPVLYNARRLFSLSTWLAAVDQADPAASLLRQTYWPLFGRLLCLANVAFWSFNLFGFLVPVYLPYAFGRYLESNQAGRNTIGTRPAYWVSTLQRA